VSKKKKYILLLTEYFMYFKSAYKVETWKKCRKLLGRFGIGNEQVDKKA
jgi:hypothetical protein